MIWYYVICASLRKGIKLFDIKINMSSLLPMTIKYLKKT